MEMGGNKFINSLLVVMLLRGNFFIFYIDYTPASYGFQNIFCTAVFCLNFTLKLFVVSEVYFSTISVTRKVLRRRLFNRTVLEV
jgi:hypothetical protein